MDRRKPVQEGVRVKLPAGITWTQLTAMTPEQIRDRDLFAQGFQPLPHGTMIDGLMEVASLSSAQLRRARVDLSALARRVAVELQLSAPGRKVEFVIAFCRHFDPEFGRRDPMDRLVYPKTPSAHDGKWPHQASSA